MTEITAVPCSPPSTACGCGCGGACGCSNPVGLERTRFFPRMLVGPDELTQDQLWLRDKQRRHNRLLHGWGVVCGCDVSQALDDQGKPVPWTVLVEPGYVLGPFGDEIVVDCAFTFDLRRFGSGGGPCGPPLDPWCSDVRVDRKPEETLYVAVRYDECLTRPVRTLAGCGCGCEDADCEYSRIRESFALTALDELPDAYRTPAKQMTGRPDAGGALGSLSDALFCSAGLQRSVRACPPCPTDPWVVLADVVADADGMLTIDPIAHRRYVASFSSFSFSCAPPVTTPDPTPDPTETICHRVYGYEWEGISAMPPELTAALQAGDLVEARRLGLLDLGTVEFPSGASTPPSSHLTTPFPFTSDSLASIYVYEAGAASGEPADDQARQIADLVVTNIGTTPATTVSPTRLPVGIGCPLVTVVILGIWEIG